MPETDISSADYTNQEGAETLFSVDPVSTEGAQDQKETYWINDKWTQQLGYYKKIPELKAAIDAKARWTIGKGFTSEDITGITLLGIKGHGKDSFNSILENQTKVMEIGGDSYAEIIRDKEGQLINIKPLDPEVMRVVANRQGILIRYDLLNKSSQYWTKRIWGRIRGKKTYFSFEPDEMFHLSRGRIADEFHGVSVVEAVQETIDARNEATRDYRVLLRRNVKPVKIWEIDSDKPAKIAEYKALVDKAGMDCENLIIPKGSVLPPTISAVPSNATLDPKAWINQLTQNFYQEVGVPQIIVGGAQEFTEASAKIAYLAWEQTVEDMQLYIEEQILSQLNLEINLEFPASLQNELLSDNRKDAETGATSPEDTSVNDTGVSDAT